jgi:hypothetical protein
MCEIGWTIGFEIELIAPPGATRRDLAEAFAQDQGANVRPIFYPQAEISAVNDKPVFETLTLGWEVTCTKGRLLARFVDDLTLQDDLARNGAPKAGWYRILGDDLRLMRLVGLHCDAGAPIEAVLEPARALFNGRIVTNAEGLYKLLDQAGSPIAIAAPLPGERERACELISPPVAKHHARELQNLLAAARRLDFRVPAEGAVHLHFDAVRLASSAALGRLVRAFHAERETLRQQFRPNPRCRRLGAWSKELIDLVHQPGFDALPWHEARRQLAATGLSKFCDFNITNIVDMDAEKFTFEIRIIPPSMDAGEIVSAAAYFADILHELAA